MAAVGELFKVVGGASKGGIIVRNGKDTASTEEAERLSTGALIRTLEVDAASQRVLFRKVSGSGPAGGWVSTTFKGKDMLSKAGLSEAVEEDDVRGLALELYCMRFGAGEEQADGKLPWNRKPFTWKMEPISNDAQAEPQVRAALERDLGMAAQVKNAGKAFAAANGNVRLCTCCQLPLGEMMYKGMKDQKPFLLHGECMAQEMLRDLQEEEKAINRAAAETKKSRREEFEIGWAHERIPKNLVTAARLKVSDVSKGMCCLVFDENTGAVRVAPTIEPAAAVNLEYLATALQVRSREGCEPVFSLDPVDPRCPKDSMQVKRFEPAWLAGTSVGDVLFQADYHLKELSMGEYEQPVLGMNSIHDYSDVDQQDMWKAREWFVVRQAEVQMTGDNVLLPLVKMGVEAREQILGDHGLEDVRTTRQDHPLVKYANSFTHNFDLIAERKSVVYHLRELAKASVLAKFLFEVDAVMEEAWLRELPEEESACCLEIPQLWNERRESQIKVQDGKIMEVEDGLPGKTKMHRLYGGVQFGLDKFQLSGARQPARMLSAGLAARQFVQPARHLSATLSAGLATRQFQRSFGPLGVQPARVSAGVGLDKFALSGARQPTRMLSAGLAARQFVQPARHLSATLSAGLATRQFQRSFGPLGVQPSRVAGVDLNLNEFNLAAATRVDASAQIARGIDISAAFWQHLGEEANSMFSKDDLSLLKSVFDPTLCDRREEGESFIPPDTSFAYIQSLRTLVKEEEAIREQRKQEFVSANFEMESPGLLFPSSWRSCAKISRDTALPGCQGRQLQPKASYKNLAGLIEPALKDASPIFDKSTEDGTRFRIYRLGSLEVRTLQELQQAEVIAAVFTSSLTSANRSTVRAGEQEKVIKATEYVEASRNGPRLYTVFETEAKNVVVSELTPAGLKRETNPEDLEDRNSLAKVYRTKDCGERGLTVGAVLRYEGSANLFNWVTGQK